MELITLDGNNQPYKLVENYDSLIWTERYNTVGDFQLTTGDIQSFMALLPEGTRISLRDSDVVMVVETHQIDRKKNSLETLTIKGRSFESVLDRRVSVHRLNPELAEWTFQAKAPTDAIYWAVYTVIIMGFVDSADIFPSSMFQWLAPDDYDTSTGPLRPFVIPKGNLLTTVLAFIQTESKADPLTTPATPAVEPHGIRSMRPNGSGTAVGVQIYSGIDRSSTVHFDATRDLLDDGTYLFSKIGSATTAYILGLSNSAKMDKTAVEATGLDRRVILVDATGSDVTDADILREQGSMSLAEAHETAMFDGSINEDLSTYIYGVNYSLGDIVSLRGDYGLNEKARVTEYIRTDGPTGPKAYPTLSTIPS